MDRALRYWAIGAGSHAAYFLSVSAGVLIQYAISDGLRLHECVDEATPRPRKQDDHQIETGARYRCFG